MPPYAYVLLIAGGAGLIALIVFLLRKFVPGLGSNDQVADEKTIAEENVQSRIMTLEEENPLEEDEDE